MVNAERPPLRSQVSAGVGSETVYLHVLQWVFDALSLRLCASVADNDVCVGLSACFFWRMWATRIFNLCSKPLQSSLSHLPFSFFFSFLFSSSARFKLIPSQGRPCTPELQTAHTTERCLRAIVLQVISKPSVLHSKWARPLLGSIKQRGSYVPHLFSFSSAVDALQPATGAGRAQRPQGSGPPNAAVSVGKSNEPSPWSDFRSPLGRWYGPFEWDLCAQCSPVCRCVVVQRMKQFSEMALIPHIAA